MHRGRVLGGNARKRKAKLTDATFSAMLGPSARAAGQALLAAQGAEVAERVEADGLLFEQPVLVEQATIEVTVRTKQADNSTICEFRPFACQEYDFGYAECPTCHNDQVYYAHRAFLAAGFSFRCRVCRSSMTASAKS